MTDHDDRLTGVEKRLDTLGEDVGILKDDVRVLKDDVRVVKADVARLRVLYEDHDAKIRTIAEVQAHHGEVLEDIRQKLEPLGDIHDFVRRIAHDHEQRLSALEKHTGIQ